MFDALRRRVFPKAQMANWREDLLGERRLRQVEARPEEIAAAIRDVDDEIRAILAEQRRRG